MGDKVQWPLAKDVSSVKLDESHYFFTIWVPQNQHGQNEVEVLNYGLTIAARGQEGVLKKLDEVLERYSFRLVEKVEGVSGWEVMDGSVMKETSPEELKREMVEERCGAYWTTVAPNVEDYSGRSARLIAAASGKVARGILRFGDVAVEMLRWGNDHLKKRLRSGSPSQITPQTMARMKSVRSMTKKAEQYATGIRSGVFSAMASKAGKKLYRHLPGETGLAVIDGFDK